MKYLLTYSNKHGLVKQAGIDINLNLTDEFKNLIGKSDKDFYNFNKDFFTKFKKLFRLTENNPDFFFDGHRILYWQQLDE